MKSKLIIGSPLLFVGLSACADPAAPRTGADAGWLDGGSQTTSNSELSDSGQDSTSRNSSSTTGNGSAFGSSDAGADGSGGYTTAESGSAPEAGSSDSSEASAFDSGSVTIVSNDAADDTENSGAEDAGSIETSGANADAGTTSSDAYTTADDSSEVAGGDATSEQQNTDPSTADSEFNEDAGSTSDDSSSTSGIESAEVTNDTSTDDSVEIVLDAGLDAAVDSGTSDSSSHAIDAGSPDAGGPDAGSLDSNYTGVDESTDAGSSDESTDAGNGSDSSTSDETSTDETSTDVPLTGQQLFEEEQFGGNGRTCLTCHGPISGSISPAEIQALYAADPNGPMFRSIDSNDGLGNDYSILLERATFRVELALPQGVTLVADPNATSIVLRRSALSTINTPGLDNTLMWDGRASDLMDQALGAITGHAESTVTPTQEQLELIAEFEQTDEFFSSDTLRDYYDGGPAPQWPPGNTAAEQRGRRWFAEDPTNAPRFNICGQCHGGPMTNETQQNSGLPVGEHFQTANVSEFNSKGNPTYTFRFPDPNNPGQTIDVTTPDPGLALTTGDVRDVNFFKIPTLWGVSKTAPYFHDNSAATLEELMDHYEDHLATFLFSGFRWPRPHVPTAQDKADIVAYLKLL